MATAVMACSSTGPPVALGTPSAAPASPTPALIPSPSTPAMAAGQWPTYHRDSTRAGYLPGPGFASVSRGWTSRHLDGAVYAEPVVSANSVVVATENNSVYAFDLTDGHQLWMTNLGPAANSNSFPCGDILPQSGITGTPALDADTAYVVANLEPAHHVLAAISLADGKVEFQVPIDPPGDPPETLQQRGALAFANGRVYAPFGGLYGDCGRYHGWVVSALGLDGSGITAYKVPAETGGGIWAPSGPAVLPSGDVLVATGNAGTGPNFDYGNSVISLSPTLRQATGYFAPTNWADLSSRDTDLGSVGPLLLGGGLVFQGGKEGFGYLLRADALGGLGAPAFQGNACPAFGGEAYIPGMVVVACPDRVLALKVDTQAPSFSTAWQATGLHAGAPIAADSAVWVEDVDSGRMLALSPGDGHVLFEATIGQVEHFATPSAAGNRILVTGGGTLQEFVTTP